MPDIPLLEDVRSVLAKDGDRMIMRGRVEVPIPGSTPWGDLLEVCRILWVDYALQALLEFRGTSGEVLVLS